MFLKDFSRLTDFVPASVVIWLIRYDSFYDILFFLKIYLYQSSQLYMQLKGTHSNDKGNIYLRVTTQQTIDEMCVYHSIEYRNIPW